MTTETFLEMIVRRTTDYSKFSFLTGNRVINNLNFKKLLISMKEEQLLIPIIVNERLQIIDGQHRFMACVELKLPVYFIVNRGYGLDQVKRANTIGVNWTKEDFLQTYIAEENENYIKLDGLRKDTGLQLTTLLKIIGVFQQSCESFINEKFKEGTFEIDIDDSYSGAEYFCNVLEMFSEYKDYKSIGFVTAFLKLYFHPDYDPRIMERQSKFIVNFQPKYKSANALLEDFCKNVYSYRLGSKRIYFNRELNRFFK